MNDGGSDHYDVVVIGTGTAASQIAYGCREAGKSVAVVDSKPFGGTCALRGCDPKKVLVGAAELVDWATRMEGRGVKRGARIDWPELMRFKRTFTDPVPKQREEAFAREGIDTIHGRARFTGPDRIRVNERELTAGQIAIATGMRPATLNVPGEDLLVTSEQFLDLNDLPGRITFVGGGYIAFEFGHLAARAGAKVTIINRGSRPLTLFDKDLTERLVRKTREIGVDVELNAAVTRVEPGVVYANGKRFEADLSVHAGGRVPDLDDLQLASANVEYGRRGVAVDQYLQSSSNPIFFAAGDCADTGNPALTPVAGYEGRLAAANMIAPRTRRLVEQAIPSVVFSIPPMARVGLTEDEAKSSGIKYKAIIQDSSHWYSSRRIAEDCSASKVLVDDESGRILGAHLLGTGAEEVINVFALAIHTRLTSEELKSVLFAYPGKSSDIPYMG